MCHQMQSGCSTCANSPLTAPLPPPRPPQMPGCRAPDLSEMEGTKDFYVVMGLLALSLTTFGVTCARLGEAGPKPFLLMVLFWSIYNIMPPFLFLMYACYSGERLRAQAAPCNRLAARSTCSGRRQQPGAWHM
jgi:hypothetical protein